ncbi:MAG TPA: MlaD family protein [Cyclobacteriaceae bacterium]|nr:MlaD family protein [Cyclobacteriaceae bacterium]HMV10685.1 MlaD family protein [Cyclobacteriaceae bacterium]HMV90871.1 MlaD family protein [Cyclobacteriaceae bacterium]HMX00076.1 MlaD family protein [Cyclobacteriaceae bacterium]HMX49062.1 MlaD family protein [Cyclobacteriaceae bacterium]
MKLGAFVLGGVALFLISVFYLGRENNIFSKTFTVSAVFKNVEGLKDGDNVWLSGVKIGTVKKVSIISEGQVIVTMTLKEKQNEFIKKDATANIGSDGLVGNKIVVIRPGSAVETIHDNDTINSFSPTDTQELFNLAKEVGTDIKAITSDLKVTTAKINAGQGVIGELLNEGEMAKELRASMAAIRRASENATRATNEINKMLIEINQGDGLMTKLIRDTTYAAQFSRTMENVEQVGENAKKMAADLKEVTDKMNDKNNAMGVLLTDTTFATKLKTTMTNAEKASAKLDENLKAMRSSWPFKKYFRKHKAKS